MELKLSNEELKKIGTDRYIRGQGKKFQLMLFGALVITCACVLVYPISAVAWAIVAFGYLYFKYYKPAAVAGEDFSKIHGGSRMEDK